MFLGGNVSVVSQSFEIVQISGIVQLPGYPGNYGSSKYSRSLWFLDSKPWNSVQINDFCKDSGFLGEFSFLDMLEMMDFPNILEIIDFLVAIFRESSASWISWK